MAMTKAVVLILVLALFEPGRGRPNVEKREAPENEELVAREDQVLALLKGLIGGIKGAISGEQAELEERQQQMLDMTANGAYHLLHPGKREAPEAMEAREEQVLALLKGLIGGIGGALGQAELEERDDKFWDTFKKYAFKAAKGAIKEVGVEEREDQVLALLKGLIGGIKGAISGGQAELEERDEKFLDMLKKYGLKAAKGAIKELGVEERDDQMLDMTANGEYHLLHPGKREAPEAMEAREEQILALLKGLAGGISGALGLEEREEEWPSWSTIKKYAFKAAKGAIKEVGVEEREEKRRRGKKWHRHGRKHGRKHGVEE